MQINPVRPAGLDHIVLRVRDVERMIASRCTRGAPPSVRLIADSQARFAAPSAQKAASSRRLDWHSGREWCGIRPTIRQQLHGVL